MTIFSDPSHTKLFTYKGPFYAESPSLYIFLKGEMEDPAC